jgi:ethanolaminephosphotransferase
MKNSIPSWAHLYMAFAIWAAQTLDAIDGKHARNTGQSSPVGQLLDHGADAFCNCFSTCMLCAGFGFGDGFITLIILIYIQVGCLITVVDILGY